MLQVGIVLRVGNEDDLAGVQGALELGVPSQIHDIVPDARVLVGRHEPRGLAALLAEEDGAPIEAEGLAELLGDGLQDVDEVQRARDLLQDIDRLAETAEAALGAGELRAVVAAGGDGTAALVANRTRADTPLALLPLGTENLLSKYLGISTDPQKVCEMIDQGATVRMDAGCANGHIFLLMSGCGFDAEVVRRVHAARTGHIHHLSYLAPIWQSIRNYEYPPLRVKQAVVGVGRASKEQMARTVMALLGEAPHAATGTAETDSLVYAIPRDLFFALVLEAEAFRIFVFSALSHRMADLMALLDDLAFRGVAQRLAVRLLQHAHPIVGTHQALADELGTRREVVSRILGTFQRAGLIRLGRKRIEILDAPALDDLRRV